MNTLSQDQIEQFRKTIYNFYEQSKRNFAWRENISPYKIVVSEIMLQQTQTKRVISKFEQWIMLFPDFKTAAQASNHEILTAWQGLGYNKRGLALAQIAQIVERDYQGILPCDPKILETFPAIGPNTAGSICAFAFNIPTVFIETNIRTVYTHTFFQDKTEISDKQLLPLIEQTIDTDNARHWYYALMDYGVYLKQQLPRINSASKHYTKQSQFEGSKRQVRGAVIKILTQLKQVHWDDLIELLYLELPNNNHNRQTIIQSLIKEKVVQQKNDILFL